MPVIEGSDRPLWRWRGVGGSSVRPSAAPFPWRRQLYATAQVTGFCLLTALLAQVRVPVPGTPVPVTLQTLAVLLAGMTVPPARAAAAMALYVAAGWAMLAAGATGPGWFAAFTLNPAGPTGGFLVGFVAGAAVVSALCGRRPLSGRPSLVRLMTAGAAGTVVIFAFGAGWYRMFVAGSWAAAWAQAVAPFVLGAALKLALAAALVRGLGGGMGRGGRSGAEGAGA